MRNSLALFGVPSAPLKSAFAIAAKLHDIFDKHPKVTRGMSLTHCVFSAQACAEFFSTQGFQAVAVPCALVLVRKDKDNQPIYVRRIGTVDGHAQFGAGKWDGHMAVLVEDFLFDPTFWQIEKTLPLPVMLALPANRRPVDKFMALSTLTTKLGDDTADIYWMGTPDNDKFGEEKNVNLKRDIVAAMKDLATKAAVYPA